MAKLKWNFLVAWMQKFKQNHIFFLHKQYHIHVVSFMIMCDSSKTCMAITTTDNVMDVVSFICKQSWFAIFVQNIVVMDLCLIGSNRCCQAQQSQFRYRCLYSLRDHIMHTPTKIKIYFPNVYLSNFNKFFHIKC